MSPLAIALIVCFIANVIWLATYYVRKRLAKAEKKVMDTKDFLEQVKHQNEKIVQERESLEKKAMEIFTLYEMTNEITKKQNESEAFKVFKEKLSGSVTVEECRLISVGSQEYKEAASNKEQFVFTLKEKNRKFGYLIFKGLPDRDHEKVMILGHQFALALRRVKLYEEIEELAITDSLTEMHTRRYFLERFKEELKRSVSRKNDLSFLMIDVDHFKSFNDRYGHLVGDKILKEVGRIIKENVREIDIVGRYGGEEFCVVLPDTDSKGAIFAAERIRVAIKETSIEAYDTVVEVTISVGASVFPINGNKLMELIDKADWALYRAKKKGRNCTCAFGVYG